MWDMIVLLPVTPQPKSVKLPELNEALTATFTDLNERVGFE